MHVEWRGSWWPGKILEAVGPGAWRVTYEGWSSAWDESVGRERLRPRHVRPPGPIARGGRGVVRLLFAAGVVLVAALVATSLASSPTSEGDAPPGAVVSGAISPGRALWVEWSGSWYPAIALEPYGDGSVRVHYEGYSDSYDETVSPDRVRLR